jgi:transposase-like protein
MGSVSGWQQIARECDVGEGNFRTLPVQATISKVLYDRRKSPWDTTNAIESVNMSLRKITKNRGSFPSDEALLKLFYLALRNISKKWTMPIRDWKAALNRFTIQFEGRLPQQ